MTEQAKPTVDRGPPPTKDGGGDKPFFQVGDRVRPILTFHEKAQKHLSEGTVISINAPFAPGGDWGVKVEFDNGWIDPISRCEWAYELHHRYITDAGAEEYEEIMRLQDG